MAIIGYHASHEQFAPSELLRWVVLAEQAGFKAVNCSDHFHPWSQRQGQSGFSFAWLGAALQATTLPFGVVCAPGQRYHPAIVAQAAATLAELFPGRFWMALGSGEALNEKITGEKWPEKPVRNARLKECVEIIQRLLGGESVTHHGHVTVENARLYTLPPQPPLLLGAAISVETAQWMGRWADGLITIQGPIEHMREVIKAFRKSGGKGKPIYLKAQLSYARSPEAALQGAYEQWRTNIFSGTVLADLWRVEQFDALGEHVQPQEMHQMVRISADIQQHLEWIRQDIELGYDKIILHNVNREQELFIRDFGEKVLPHLSG